MSVGVRVTVQGKQGKMVEDGLDSGHITVTQHRRQRGGNSS